ncbi:hypothetical protein AN958_07320 [Leucoagaricus sp. SymC.cos]|nr:hypothetical protein AN958_07320 [Leucoagaricus sp. SymC.cos]
MARLWQGAIDDMLSEKVSAEEHLCKSTGQENVAYIGRQTRTQCHVFFESTPWTPP